MIDRCYISLVNRACVRKAYVAKIDRRRGTQLVLEDKNDN